MDVRVLSFARPDSASSAASAPPLIPYGGGHVLASPTGATVGIAFATDPVAPVEVGPFTLTRFGAKRRLAWPGGGCGVRALARLAFWGDRYAVVIDQRTMAIVDAVVGRQARIELPRQPTWLGYGLLEVGDDVLVIPNGERVAHIDLAALAAIVASEDREIEIRAPVDVQRAPGELAVTRAKVVRGRTRDPAVTGAPLAPTARVPELERLLAALARDPDDDATRGVLVDLLQEIGEAYGAWVARERAGGAGPSRAHRRAALGPLAHFIGDVAYRGGLPWSAALVRRPPDEPALLAAAREDLRLGMLSELRIAKGPPAVYRALIGSPRALGLRRVDAPDRETLAALIAGGRDQLTHLYDVRFSKPAAVALLADPTFDRVGELETFVQAAHLDALLARVAADAHGVFARAPRTLVLRARASFPYGLLGPALRWFARLPVRAVVVDAVSVRREDGRAIVRVASTAAVPPAYWLQPLAEALPGVAVVELPPDAHARAAVRRALPHADVRPLR